MTEGSSLDPVSSALQLKNDGNTFFGSKDFTSAINKYTEALDLLSSAGLPHDSLILTNRSAAKIHLGMFEDALIDAQAAIDLDISWTKAYFRKATALDSLGRLRDCYKCWIDAGKNCESASLKNCEKHSKEAKKKWSKVFREVPVESQEDLKERYELLNESREKLSTLAHFWNESSDEERLKHLHHLMSLISGEGESTNLQEITSDMMLPMPLHNYPDFPKENILPWCLFFHDLPSEDKTVMFEKLWFCLSSTDQTAVITDLKLFFSPEMQAQYSAEGSVKGLADLTLDPDES